MQLRGSGWFCVHAARDGKVQSLSVWPSSRRRCRLAWESQLAGDGDLPPGRQPRGSQTAHMVAPGRSCLSPHLAQKPHGLVPADSLRQLVRETAQTPGVVDGAHPTMGWESEKADRILQALVLPEFLQAAT